MELNINALSDFVKNAEVMFSMGAKSIPQVARGSGLFKEIAIPQLTGNTREFSEIELEEYASKKTQSDQASRAKVQQGYSKIGTLYRVAKDIGVSYEWRTQGKYPEIKQSLISLGGLAAKRLDLDLTHRITFCTATSYTDKDGDTVSTTVGDTYQLAYTAHTLKGSSTTYRNRLANNPQFSRGALEAMELMAKQNSYNHMGEQTFISFDVIWSGNDPNTVNSIKEVLKSTSNPTQNNSAVVNTYQTKYRHVELPRLATTAVGAPDTTKEKYWGLASTAESSAYLGMHEEPHMKAPTGDGTSAEEFSTDDWNFGVRGGWMIVIAGSRWFCVSTGDATA
ncbi:MAG: hypothetical protein WC269_01375 [Candidatus Gracilibacteria bacterium]|jgi:hypothetical protein